MKKEVFLAIAIGFGLGLVITLGIWVANKSLKTLPSTTQATPTPTPNAQDIPSASPTPALALTISTPEDESLVSTNKTTLKGKTAASAAVTITYEGGQTIVTADHNGDFTFEVPLIAGYNVVAVSAFDKTGQTATQSLTVTYSTAKL